MRFFAYSEKYKDFKHDVAPFLDDYFKSKATSFDSGKKEGELNSVLDFVEKYFPEPYFSRKGRDNATPRVRFEAIAAGVNLALKQKPDLVPTYMEWLDSNEFKVHTTSDTSNNTKKLICRIEFVKGCLLNEIENSDLHYD